MGPMDRPTPPEPTPDSPLVPTDIRPNSALRLRDVKALNRSFRRLAEVQEALLSHLETGQPTTAGRNRWGFPAAVALAIVGFIGGIGAIAWWDSVKSAERPALAVTAQLPPIEIPEFRMPDITVPPTTLDPEVISQWNRILASMEDQQRMQQEMLRETRNNAAIVKNAYEDSQQRVRELETAMLENEQKQMEMLALLSDPARLRGLVGITEAPQPTPASTDAAMSEPTEAAFPGGVSGTVEEPTADWVDDFNALLAADGYGGVRLESGERVEGAPVLANALFYQWNEQGTFQGMIRAETVRLELHQMAGNLVLIFEGGHRLMGRTRHAFPASGYRMDLDGITVDSWLQAWPSLETSAPKPVVEPIPAPIPAPEIGKAELVQAELDKLLSVSTVYGYYRLNSLGEIGPNALRYVQINWYDSTGKLLKTLEADSMEIVLHDDHSVELLLKRGAILESGRRTPFFQDRFRLFLPRQPIGEWRTCGAPYTEQATSN